ncbi:GIY-YIG nuclease family protein [Winogradskyella thalassocola]|uniref:GIY-YIG catalytic domain-containing protein n=1 Tax=Winogradskyella thalassocola TaxID=262004 RepID=A0A1G8BAJ7_9FLAO|nr:GIY-YIG nuclease family protein [Winogradskyella thalassocola]SDH29610.1 GIY-YIG catalytic domain-containing protein [Winogradskyella thalassocola]
MDNNKFIHQKILLNELLNLKNLNNVKIRFNLMFEGVWDPIEFYKNGDFQTMLNGQYHNYSKNKSYKEGQINIGLVRLKEKNQWLLFHIGLVTKDLNRFNTVGYEYQALTQYEKYFGRLVLRYKNTSQNMVRLATSVINQCEVLQILPDTFDNDLFPGYEKVNISWSELSRVVTKETWRTALENQKGVYLITDISNGKMYVGSAYGDNMILGRWKTYKKTGHGENVELKKLSFDYIKSNFKYSILDIFKSTTDDKTIIAREIWWKEVLQTRQFGYNKN